MSFQMKEPILVIGLGGIGSKLAVKAKDSINSDCLIISNDAKDLSSENPSIHVSTDSVVNPSVQLIRGSTYKVADQIKSITSVICRCQPDFFTPFLDFCLDLSYDIS